MLLIRGKSAQRKSGRLQRRFRRGLLVLAMAGAALAQTESQIESDEVRRVGSHLNCQCGCKDNFNCMMAGGQCPFCKPMRTKIFRMQQAGMNDTAIIASFVRDSGDKIFRPDPDLSFWLVPYFSLGLGGFITAFILMRMRDRARNYPSIEVPASGLSGGADAPFALYREAIEKDTEALE